MDHSSKKTAKSVHLVEKGLNKLRLNLAEVNPTYKIELEVCLTLLVESQHAVSHFKHPSCKVLEYAMDLGSTMNKSLKRTSQSLAYYFTNACIIRYLRKASRSKRNENSLLKMLPVPLKEMSRIKC